MNKLQAQLDFLQKELDDTEDTVNMETYGLYKPRYNFANSLGYKNQLNDVRNNQKRMIRNLEAYEIFNPMLLDNSSSKGHSMQKKNGKQLVRSFNVECEAAINKITYSNIERIEKRINKSFEQLNKLNNSIGIALTFNYLNSKIDELHLAYEYAEKKQEEKEKLREQREREREDKRAQKQIEIAQKKLNKELDHYKKALNELTLKLNNLTGKDREDVQQNIKELHQNISQGEAEKKDLDYRQENATAGYVYIISNIGSFGPDVVKIGVTRRLDPQERIDELGSASVPFKFDVHAFIFSYDAYSLETELHQRFSDKRVNKINNRKEYFRVSISEIEKVLEEYKDLTVDFNEKPEAIEYNQSLNLASK
ncbi:DUF4041 domain-containing protein [Companilactobacillus farciminis]|uniref:DUF4041 domain-containing protein n=1 Tax=Companilactobacillus farciminis TaxID=1612 RepID=UPI001F366E65|nr:DUF4041 domain-containing protein [Companilactobacillus farciminis]